jgi:hypothetical protein
MSINGGIDDPVITSAEQLAEMQKCGIAPLDMSELAARFNGGKGIVECSYMSPKEIYEVYPEPGGLIGKAVAEAGPARIDLTSSFNSSLSRDVQSGVIPGFNPSGGGMKA